MYFFYSSSRFVFFSMKMTHFSLNTDSKHRAAIYAAYDRHDFDKADLLYLRALRRVSKTIVFVMDNECSQEKCSWLVDQGYCDFVIAGRHGEYDFGSYKKGWFLLKKRGLLSNLDELIMCNDSCYAPLVHFEKMFQRMQLSSCDYWGVVGNRQLSYHVQSFFLVFRSAVISSDIFNKFIESIESQNSVLDVIMKYEIGLSRSLRENGFISDVYIQYPQDNRYPVSVVGREINLTVFPIWLMEQGSPLVKKKAFYEQESNMEGGDELLHAVKKRMGKVFIDELGIDVALAHPIRNLYRRKDKKTLMKALLHLIWRREGTSP